MDQPSYASDVTFYADGTGYELHAQDYMDGFAYVYAAYFGVTGWVDLDDVGYVGDYVYTSNDSGFTQTLYSCVDSGFLALRSAPSYSDGNIIAQIWSNGTALCMTGDYVGNYGYCYVPAYDSYGWVDIRFTY